MAALGDEIKALEATAKELENELSSLELTIPNLFDDGIPIGADETANRELRTWGERPAFSFEAKAHWDLGPDLGIIDFERAVKVASSRFAVLRGHGALLRDATGDYAYSLITFAALGFAGIAAALFARPPKAASR